jgi:hypothetical protein
MKKQSKLAEPQALLSYLPDYTIYLNLPCVLTLSKTLRVGMPYMYHEGQKTFAIRLLHVWDSDGFVYLRIQNMQTGQVYKISSILKDDTEFILWEIASLDYLMNLTMQPNKKSGTS